MSQMHPPAQVPPAGPRAAEEGDHLAYQPPLLRSHGVLRDLTAKSGDKQPSDRSVKENIVALVWVR
jgi:hypothetical protein